MNRRLVPALVVLLAAALIAGAWWLLKDLGGPAAPKRQVARIALLPDQPPPPPPQEKPPPKVEPKEVVREEQVRQAESPKPANEPLKMEGAAGDGPSAFAAGPVRSEYAGGPPQLGGAASAAAPRDRAQERLYANAARQLLRDALERHFRSDVDEAQAEFRIWLQADGAIRRVALEPSNDARLDRELQAALDEASRSLRLPPPPARLGGGEPMRFRLTVKPQAG